MIEVFKIETRNSKDKYDEEKDRKDYDEREEKVGTSYDGEKGIKDDEVKNKVEKIEICYFCLRKFDMNKDNLSYYKYGKYPMCGYCAEFYGFYSDDIK